MSELVEISLNFTGVKSVNSELEEALGQNIHNLYLFKSSSEPTPLDICQVQQRNRLEHHNMNQKSH